MLPTARAFSVAIDKMKPRKIVVTGASSGIGRSCVERLLERGDSVVGIARRAAPFEHPDLQWHSLDLARDGAARQLAEIVPTHPEISAVISNAGAGHFGSLENFSASQIVQSIQHNLTSHLLVAHAFMKPLKRQSRSDLILVGSESSLAGGRQGSLYCAAKFGIRGFAQSLREECARQNVHVGIINPGMVRSEFFESLDFRPGEEDTNALTPNDVVDAMVSMLDAGDNAVIDEINLSPLKRVIDKSPKSP